MKNIAYIGSAIVLAAIFAGCTPDKLTVTVPASSIEKVKAGEICNIKARIIYSTMGKDENNNLPKVKRASLPHLGEGAEIEIEKEEYKSTITASFKIPFGPESAASRFPRSILAMVMTESGKIELREGSGLEALNSSLDDVDSSIKAEFNGGSTYFKFTGNTDKNIKMQIVGAFANDKPYALGTVTLEEDEEIIVTFNRGSDSIWHTIDPFVMIGK